MNGFYLDTGEFCCAFVQLVISFYSTSGLRFEQAHSHPTQLLTVLTHDGPKSGKHIVKFKPRAFDAGVTQNLGIKVDQIHEVSGIYCGTIIYLAGQL